VVSTTDPYGCILGYLDRVLRTVCQYCVSQENNIFSSGEGSVKQDRCESSGIFVCLHFTMATERIWAWSFTFTFPCFLA
jgi:hypothetical protein